MNNLYFSRHHVDLDYPLSSEELNNALLACRHRTAAGPDEVTYVALKNVGDVATNALLKLFKDA